MLHLHAAITVIAQRGVLIDAALIVALELTHQRQLIARVVDVAGRRVDIAAPVEDLRLYCSTQHVMKSLLLPSHLIRQRHNLATCATTAGVARFFVSDIVRIPGSAGI